MNTTFGSRMREGGAVLLVILAIATALRVWRLDAPLWLDEVLMLHDFVEGPLVKTITTYPTDNQHPLYSFSASLAALVLGQSAWAIRLPAVIFGLIGIAVAYTLGRRFLSRGGALWATALLALSPHHIWFSQNARGYTALALFAAVALDSWIDALQGSRRAAVVCGLALALAVWTHLTGVFVAAGLGLSWCVALMSMRAGAPPSPSGRNGACVTALALGAVGAILLHAPMIGDMVVFFTGPKAPRPVSAWRSPWWTVEELLRGIGSGSAILGGIIAALGGASVVAGAIQIRKRVSGFTVAALSPVLLAPIVTFALGRHLWPRFFFAQAIPLALLATSGLASAAARWLPAHITGRLAMASLFALTPLIPGVYATKQDFPAAKAFIEQRRAATEDVSAVGTAYWACGYLYAPEYRGANDIDALAATLDRPGRSWVMSASPIFVSAYRPAIHRALENRCDRVAVYPSALGDVEFYRERE